MCIGLTRIRTDKALLDSKVDIKNRKIQDSIGKQRVQRRPGRDTYSKVALPGLDGMDPECDPSQFSHQVISELIATVYMYMYTCVYINT
jgi:hypothetical protein